MKYLSMLHRSRIATVLGPLFLLGALAVPAAAKEPLQTTFTRTFASTLPCPSGPVNDTLTLNVMFQVFFDNAGNPLRTTTHVQLDEIFYNPLNQKSAEATGHYNYSDNGSTITIHGLTYSLNIAGRGAIFLDAGKIVLDPTTGTVLYSTPHTSSGSLDLLCSAVQ